jgi:catechol O-methyltransferase
MPQSHDGREDALLAFILTHPDIDNIKENPSRLLQLIEEYSYSMSF